MSSSVMPTQGSAGHTPGPTVTRTKLLRAALRDLALRLDAAAAEFRALACGQPAVDTTLVAAARAAQAEVLSRAFSLVDVEAAAVDGQRVQR